MEMGVLDVCCSHVFSGCLLPSSFIGGGVLGEHRSLSVT